MTAPLTAQSATNVELRPGFIFKVNAPGTSTSEWWEIKEVKQDGSGETEVVAKGSKTPFLRSFRPEQFGEFKQSKNIITEEVEMLSLISGKEMWVENVIHMPEQARRGRKPSGYFIDRMVVED